MPDLGSGETLQYALHDIDLTLAESVRADEERLLDACEELGRVRGLDRIVAGVNVARHDAYRRLLARGYETWFAGVIMQRPNKRGYCRPDAYVIDDLR